MLDTGLEHIDSIDRFEATVGDNENVMICCGRMGPMCLPVYDAMESLRGEYPHVQFRDMDFDGPASPVIKGLPEVRGFMGLPFTVYFKNGKVVKATSSIQSREQVSDILDGAFGSDD